MNHFEISIPDEISEREAKIALAGKLYEMGKLTLGQASEVAGYSKRTFMEIMGDYGIKYISYPASDLKEDLINV